MVSHVTYFEIPWVSTLASAKESHLKIFSIINKSTKVHTLADIQSFDFAIRDSYRLYRWFW